MTRINSNVSPKNLLDQHLMAEYRELPMVFASLRRSLKSKRSKDVLDGIPPKFLLNRGHVMFFYDKLKFLDDRYLRLKAELVDRGFNLDPSRNMYDYREFPPEFGGSWESNDADDTVVLDRISEKYNMKPTWYKYCGKSVVDYKINGACVIIVTH